MVTQNYNLVLDEQTMPWGRETVPDKNQTGFNCNRLHRIEYALARIRHCPKRAMWLHLNPCFVPISEGHPHSTTAHFIQHILGIIHTEYHRWRTKVYDGGVIDVESRFLLQIWNCHRGVRGNNGKWLVTSSTVVKIATIGVYMSTKIHTSLQICVSMFSSLQKTAVDNFIYFLNVFVFIMGHCVTSLWHFRWMIVSAACFSRWNRSPIRVVFTDRVTYRQNGFHEQFVASGTKINKYRIDHHASAWSREKASFGVISGL